MFMYLLKLIQNKECAANCVKCKQSQPSYCTDCGDVTKTHRILDENNKCVCDTGY